MSKEKLVEIVTPTYNRAEHLKKLYQSLCNQKDAGFRWILVDDGSTDSTAELVENWLKESPIDIRYLHKENGGKHTALNLAFTELTLPLTFIVDSDDVLPDDAVEIIRNYYDKYSDRQKELNLCAFSFLRAYPDGTINCGEFPKDEMIGTVCEIRINGGIAGDKAEVFFTNVIQKYRFKEFSGEKFMPEDALWMEISGPYNMVHINRVVYISDYLEGGLTKSGRRMKMHSPQGMMYRSVIYLRNDKINLKTRMKMQLLYHVYHRFAIVQIQAGTIEEDPLFGQENYRIPRKILYYGTIIPAMMIGWSWKKKYA